MFIMTKKNYFMVLWALACAPTIMAVLGLLFFGAVPISEFDPAAIRTSVGVMSLIITSMMVIFVRGFVITIGLHFSEKINAQLLFLKEQFDLKKDILRPAVWAAAVYASIQLLVRVLLIKFTGANSPVLSLFSNPDTTWGYKLIILLMSLLGTINHDIWLLLLVVSGIGLLVKKIANNISLSRAMLISVFISSVLSGFYVIWKFGISVLAIDSLVESIGIPLCLGLLFWKKGFETAVFCHLMIVFILYLVAPAVVLALGL